MRKQSRTKKIPTEIHLEEDQYAELSQEVKGIFRGKEFISDRAFSLPVSGGKIIIRKSLPYQNTSVINISLANKA